MKKVILISIAILILAATAGYLYYWTMASKAQAQIQENLKEAKRIYDTIPIWHKKIHTQQDLRIGIITDTHVHPTRINKNDKSDNASRRLKEKDLEPLRNFIIDMNAFQPDFIVHLGDVIEGTGDLDNVGITGIKLVDFELKKLEVPIYWAIGNHDLRSVTKEQFEETLFLESVTQSFDIGDYRFIILDANYNNENVSRTPTEGRYIRGHLPPQQLEWLEKQLATDKQVFVFMHHGAFLDDSVGDYDEDKQANKMKQSIDNAKELHAILDEYRVTGLFDGHMEARRFEKRGWTAYNSLTGTKKSKDYPDSYYELTITDGVPDVTMYYLPKDATEIKKIDFESDEK